MDDQETYIIIDKKMWVCSECGSVTGVTFKEHEERIAFCRVCDSDTKQDAT